jgi:hypothetical protein
MRALEMQREREESETEMRAREKHFCNDLSTMHS